MAFRLIGIALIATCAFVLRRMHLLVQVSPGHQPTAPELALGLIAVLAGICGAACLIVGPPLLRPYAWPPPDEE